MFENSIIEKIEKVDGEDFFGFKIDVKFSTLTYYTISLLIDFDPQISNACGFLSCSSKKTADFSDFIGAKIIDFKFAHSSENMPSDLKCLIDHQVKSVQYMQLLTDRGVIIFALYSRGKNNYKHDVTMIITTVI